jgi:hypothetical protein
MIKKLFIAFVIIVLTKIAVFVFIENKDETELTENAWESARQETNKLSKKQIEDIVTGGAHSKLSQNELESMVLVFNKNYPKTLPNGIRIDRLTSGPALITYHKTMTNHSAAEIVMDESAMRADVINEACANPGVSNFLKSGISVQTIYNDQDNVFVYKNTTSPKDCIL